MGIEAFAEAALVPASRLAYRSHRRRKLPGSVQVLSERTAHSDGRGGRPSAARHVAGRLPLERTENAPQPDRAASDTHFTARVRLTKQAPEAWPCRRWVCRTGTHHRSRRHLSPLLPRTRIPSYGAGVVGRTPDCRTAGERLAANHLPSELPTVMAPRLIELCFQTAGLWEMGVAGPHGSAAAH
jgi:hypothetical protein